MGDVIARLAPLLEGEAGSRALAPLPAAARAPNATTAGAILALPQPPASERSWLQRVVLASVGAALVIVGSAIAMFHSHDEAATPPPNPVASTGAVVKAAAPRPRHRCHPDLSFSQRQPCGESGVAWCDADDHPIACCADGLVAAGHDGMCICPPVPSEASASRGCKDTHDPTPFTKERIDARLRDAKERVRQCFAGDGGVPGKIVFAIEFSPEGDAAVARILSSDSPDPDKQACALGILRGLRGWPGKGGGSGVEMEWDLAEPPRPAASAK
jgi:hypothetical protein